MLSISPNTFHHLARIVVLVLSHEWSLSKRGWRVCGSKQLLHTLSLYSQKKGKQGTAMIGFQPQHLLLAIITTITWPSAGSRLFYRWDHRSISGCFTGEALIALLIMKTWPLLSTWWGKTDKPCSEMEVRFLWSPEYFFSIPLLLLQDDFFTYSLYISLLQTALPAFCFRTISCLLLPLFWCMCVCFCYLYCIRCLGIFASCALCGIVFNRRYRN